MEAVRDVPSYQKDTRVFVSAPQVDLVIADIMELLVEGHIWGHQVDFIGALISANNSRVWAFDREAATQDVRVHVGRGIHGIPL